MGKNRHSKDRLFLTATEWKGIGGRPTVQTSGSSQPLAFDHCSLSLTRYEIPCASPEGVLFDLENILPYVKKHKKNPVTGSAMTSTDIIRLNMAKNTEDKWHCPVTFKIFNNNSRIVAIRTTGNVFSYEAVHELNIKAKNYTDLLNGESFTKSDIITLYDPTSPESMTLRDINNFVHTKQIRDEIREDKKQEATVRHNPATQSIMRELESRKESTKTQTLQDIIDRHKQSEYIADVQRILDLRPNTLDVNPGATFTNQKAGSSLTSSSAEVFTSNETRLTTAEEIREARWKVLRKLGKKCFVQMQTSKGNLNLEIHCDMANRASWNFIELCTRGYYDNVKFHRLIPGFMVQGGDPTGDGTGGESAWGKPFKDEFDSRLLHDARGVLSMANSGSNTNGSQFFITFAAAKHLDNMHTVFGRVVGGMAVLDRIEDMSADKDSSAPKEDILILKTLVFDSPYAEADAILENDIKARMSARLLKEKLLREKPSQQVAARVAALHSVATAMTVAPATESFKAAGGVGKYLSSSMAAVKHSGESYASEDDGAEAVRKKAKMASSSTGFSNFSGW